MHRTVTLVCASGGQTKEKRDVALECVITESEQASVKRTQWQQTQPLQFRVGDQRARSMQQPAGRQWCRHRPRYLPLQWRSFLPTLCQAPSCCEPVQTLITTHEVQVSAVFTFINRYGDNRHSPCCLSTLYLLVSDSVFFPFNLLKMYLFRSPSATIS